MAKLWNNTRYHVGLRLLRLAVFIIPAEVMEEVISILERGGLRFTRSSQ